MVALQGGDQDHLLSNYNLLSKICDSAYYTDYRVPKDGDKISGILYCRWVLCKGVTRTTFFQTITTCPKIVILPILQCIGYLMMEMKDLEFRMADGCSAEGSPGTTCLQTMTSCPRTKIRDSAYYT